MFTLIIVWIASTGEAGFNQIIVCTILLCGHGDLLDLRCLATPLVIGYMSGCKVE